MQDFIVGMINQFLPDMLYLIIAAVLSYVGVVVRRLYPTADKWIKAHTNAAQQELIKQLGQKAFVYAETVFREKSGADKLHEAISFFQKHMDSQGLTGVNLSYNMVRNEVERAWLADKSLRTFDVTAELEPAMTEKLLELPENQIIPVVEVSEVA